LSESISDAKKRPPGVFSTNLEFRSWGISSHENGNESQHENQDSAANGQNDVHQRDNGLDHIGGFSVL
jgi:hypothetical protein